MWYFMRNCSGCFETKTADCIILMISPKKVTFLYLDVCVKEIDLCRTNSCYADEILHKMTIGFGSMWNFITLSGYEFHRIMSFTAFTPWTRDSVNYVATRGNFWTEIRSRMVSLNSSLTNWKQFHNFKEILIPRSITFHVTFYISNCLFVTIVLTGGQIEEVRWTKGIRSIYWPYEFLIPKHSRISAKLSRNQMTIEHSLTNAALLTEHTKNGRIWKILVFPLAIFVSNSDE